MLKSFLIKLYAAHLSKKLERDAQNAVKDQDKIREKLLAQARTTQFGKDHQFQEIRTYEDFKQAVPIRDYEALKPYITMIRSGQSDVLWKGKPKYFAKTSGTTSGVKYIPISHESVPNHIDSARIALLNFLHLSGKTNLFDGAVIFLSGSPKLDNVDGIPTGRLSGIVNHEMPSWVKRSQKPSLATNLIDDWEEKVSAIVNETISQDMRLISGIPPWVQMYYERLLEQSGKRTIKELFPNYSLFVYGGVNYQPYRQKLSQLVGEDILTLETFPASEGFIAFQNELDDPNLLLNTNSGIFYEFVPLASIHDEQPPRLKLDQVELGKDYALIINSNAGLWGYNIGDTVRFTSLDPYKLIVSGRIKHFISAFGEHVIAKEVEQAIAFALSKTKATVVEFTVAPQIDTVGEPAYHEWFIEFGLKPNDMVAFAECINDSMIEQNIYYKDLIESKMLQTPKITSLKKQAFQTFMKKQGKLGGQNKVPRLANDRKIAVALEKYKL